MRIPRIPQKKIVIYTLRDIHQFAKRLAASLQGGEVLALTGDLGSGKTTFTQYLAKAFGIHKRITSPTFTLMHVYNIPEDQKSKVRSRKQTKSPLISKLIHMDAYRLQNADELIAIGADEYIGAPDTISVIEWADRVKDILPSDTMVIKFEHGKTKKERILSFGN